MGETATPIDLAVTDTMTRQLTQAWSFDVKDLALVETRIHAWNYTMLRLRDEGGALARRSQRDKASVAVPSTVDVNAVFLPPTRADGRKLLAAAQRGWQKMNIDAVPVAEADSVVEEARRLLHDHAPSRA